MWKYPEKIKLEEHEFILLKEYPNFGLYKNVEYGYKTCLSLPNIMDINRRALYLENNKQRKATNKQIKYRNRV